MKTRLFLNVIYNDNIISSYPIFLNKIDYIIINNKKYYRKNYISNNGREMNKFYNFIINNKNKISIIKTKNFKYYLNNGTLHNLNGPAVESESMNSYYYYVKGFYLSSKKIFLKKVRIEKINNLLKNENENE